MIGGPRQHPKNVNIVGPSFLRPFAFATSPRPLSSRLLSLYTGLDATDPRQHVVVILHTNVFFYSVAFWVCQPVLPFVAKDVGADAESWGYLTVAFSSAQSLGGLLFGLSDDFLSPRFTTIIACFGTGLGYWAMAGARSLAALILSRIFCVFMVIIQLSQSYLTKCGFDEEASRSETDCGDAAVDAVLPPGLHQLVKKNLAVLLGRMYLSSGLGMVLGALGGGYLSDGLGGHRAVMQMAGFLCVALAITDWWILPDPDPAWRGWSGRPGAVQEHRELIDNYGCAVSTPKKDVLVAAPLNDHVDCSTLPELPEQEAPVDLQSPRPAPERNNQFDCSSPEQDGEDAPLKDSIVPPVDTEESLGAVPGSASASTVCSSTSLAGLVGKGTAANAQPQAPTRSTFSLLAPENLYFRQVFLFKAFVVTSFHIIKSTFAMVAISRFHLLESELGVFMAFWGLVSLFANAVLIEVLVKKYTERGVCVLSAGGCCVLYLCYMFVDNKLWLWFIIVPGGMMAAILQTVSTGLLSLEQERKARGTILLRAAHSTSELRHEDGESAQSSCRSSDVEWATSSYSSSVCDAEERRGQQEDQGRWCAASNDSPSGGLLVRTREGASSPCCDQLDRDGMLERQKGQIMSFSHFTGSSVGIVAPGIAGILLQRVGFWTVGFMAALASALACLAALDVGAGGGGCAAGGCFSALVAVCRRGKSFLSAMGTNKQWRKNGEQGPFWVEVDTNDYRNDTEDVGFGLMSCRSAGGSRVEQEVDCVVEEGQRVLEQEVVSSKDC